MNRHEMTQEKALKIVTDVAASRKRWGRHGGFGEHTEDDVLDALVLVSETGLLDATTSASELKTAIAASNRAKGAAESRAKKYKALLDTANNNLRETVVALEDMEAQRDSAIDELAIVSGGDLRA